MLQKYLISASCITLTAISLNVNAVIIDNGNYTTDTDSGLEWLDLTETMNISYTQIVAEMGAGGAYEGWRYATGDEFNTLISNWLNIAPAISTYDKYYHNEGLVDNIVPVLGDTWDAYIRATYPGSTSDTPPFGDGTYSSGHHRSFGYIADTAGTGNQYVAALYDIREDVVANDYSFAHFLYKDPDLALTDAGSFLVRDAQAVVPIPAAAWLFGSGLLGLIGIARRVKCVCIQDNH